MTATPVGAASSTPRMRNYREYDIVLEHNGRSMTMREWSRRIGVGLETLRMRFRRGYMVKDILNPRLRANQYRGATWT